MKTIIKGIILFILLALSYPSIIYLINSYYFKPETFIAFIGMLATSIICYFTVKSVKEVIKSNKQNTIFNQKNINENEKKALREVFDKKFTLLLQEHKHYLDILNKNYDKYFNIDDLLNKPGLEILDNIRGEDETAYFNKNKYIFRKGKLYLSIKSIIDNNLLKEIFKNIAIIEKTLIKELSKINKENHTHYKYISLCGEIITSSDFENSTTLNLPNEGVDLKSTLYKRLDLHLNNNIKNKIKKSIGDKNDFSKNTLSPYMRIIYHILKLSHEHAKKNIVFNGESLNEEQDKLIKEEMKKNTNIIRSVIPNDVLLLIAINSLFFFKNSHDKTYLFSNSDLSYKTDNSNSNQFIKSSIFNDYKKYYDLLILSDFFEHLYIKYNEYSHDIVKYSFLNLEQFNDVLYKFRKHDDEMNTNYLVIKNIENRDIIQFYFNTADHCYSNPLSVLLTMFYAKYKNEIPLHTYISADNQLIKYTAKLKEININSKESKYDRNNKTLILKADFLTSFINGELIESVINNQIKK